MSAPLKLPAPRVTPRASGQAGAVSQLRGSWLWLGRMAWIVTAIATVGLFGVSVPLYFVTLQTACAGQACLAGQLTREQMRAVGALGLSTTAYAAYLVTLDVLSALGWCGVAAVLFWRTSDDRMALFSSLALLTFGGARFAGAPAALAAAYPTWWLPVALMRFLGSAYLSLFVYLFPTGRFVPWWTRWVALAWIAVQIPEFFFPASALSADAWSPVIQFAGFAAFVGSVVVAQTYRYRRVSSPAQRRQTRWVVLGITLALAGYLGLAFGMPLFSPRMVQPGSLGSIASAAGTTVAMLLIPVTLAIAILRYQLYDVDLLIHRLLVYGSLTALLVAVYFGVIVALQAVVRGLIGQESDIAIVASTLAIAALFHPLRRRLQTAIDHRFYRRNYDAVRTVDAFGATLRSEVDLARLRDQLLAVVWETMQPEHVSLWLRTTERVASPPADIRHDTANAPGETRDTAPNSQDIASRNDQVTE